MWKVTDLLTLFLKNKRQNGLRSLVMTAGLEIAECEYMGDNSSEYSSLSAHLQYL